MEGSRIALIIAADEPALFFASVASAESYLEAIDVEDGVYTAAYGPRGERFRITAEKYRVVITPDADQPDDLAGLKRLLLTFLKGVKVPASPYMNVDSLLKLCERFIRY